ncbi:hypothetical protein BKA64DRAFT_713595 [Cadophora sp. MPI-SDFR-AT-0126]|nr:hypothetical protein BKA64DRAFT_713595 [Leotiomycetes sp. MPI-SDFR-AT-0126]
MSLIKPADFDALVANTKTIAVEGKQGRNLATAASKTKTLQHYIWSTLPDSKRISKGKHEVPHFEAKALVDEFIKNSTGKYVQLGIVRSTLPIFSIGDISTNVGVFTSAVVAQPALTKGRYVLASMEETTVGKMLEMWSIATVYGPLGDEELEHMFKYWEKFEAKVAWGGDENLSKSDLGLKDEDFVGVQEAFKKIDWSRL